MASRLSLSQHNQIDAMIESGLSTGEIAQSVRCCNRTVQRRRLKRRGLPTREVPVTPSNPFIRVGRTSYITPYMQEMLREELLQQPDMFQCEMATFLYDKTGVDVTPSTISRTLAAMRWSRKTCRRVAQQRDDVLRNYYLRKVSQYKANQLVFVDESGCDKKAGQRRMGWSPQGATPVKVNELNRDTRYQILPAYTVEGILLARIYTGSTDAEWFEDFIQQLLHHCGKWPEPNSVLVMDNASWHNKGRVEQLCAEAGVRVLFLPPYSPDFNPIEEFFSELKAYIKKHWNEHLGLIKGDFETFLRLCVRAVGSRRASARGHFRHSGLSVEEPDD